MSDEQSPSEKEHEPSQKKLDDARQKGEIPRSADLILAASYSGFLLAAFAFGETGLMKAGEAAKVLLAQSDSLSTLFLSGTGNAVGGLIGGFALALSVFFLLPFLMAVLLVITQRAMVFTPSKLAPKLNRISPLSGFKNKFGRKGLFEFSKSAVKLTLISWLLFEFLRYQTDDILGMMFLSAALSTAIMMKIILYFIGIITLIAAVIGGIDYFWQHAEHQRQNRMSRKEMIDEHKSSEGDPHMKAKRRQKGQEIARVRTH